MFHNHNADLRQIFWAALSSRDTAVVAFIFSVRMIDMSNIDQHDQPTVSCSMLIMLLKNDHHHHY